MNLHTRLWSRSRNFFGLAPVRNTSKRFFKNKKMPAKTNQVENIA
jgi:hypothetical protein